MRRITSRSREISQLRGLAFLVAITTAGYGQFHVADQEYRLPPGDSGCASAEKSTAFEQGVNKKNNSPFTISYVEYKDEGTAWCPRELEDALTQIRAVIDGGKLHPIIVVNAHGWENNASKSSPDVRRFQNFISGLADEYPAPSASTVPHVIGIHLAWRGESFTIEPFKHVVSYWPRRHFAEKMGRTGIYHAVNAISATVNDPANPAIRENTILVFAGHSFGARVMENAVDGLSKKNEPGFLQKYFDNTDEAVEKAEADPGPSSNKKLNNLPRLPADLIVYINAATLSEKTIKRVRKIKKQCRKHELPMCKADPFYVALTSTGDTATGLIMFVANFVFPHFRSDHLHLISAANSPWLHTHSAPKLGCPPTERLCFDIVGKTSTDKYYLPRISSRLEVPGGDPFWIFNVHSNLVKDHTDMWNDNVLNLITAILRTSSHFKEVSDRAKAPRSM